MYHVTVKNIKSRNMKLLVTCFTLLVFATNCNSKKTVLSNSKEKTSQQSEITISYSIATRGFFQKLVLKKNSFIEFKDFEKPNAKSSDLDMKDWDECIKLLGNISLKNLPNLKSPTNYRQYDRSAYAQLTVIQKGDTIKSSDFDHKYPPAEIKPLVEYILSIPEN